MLPHVKRELLGKVIVSIFSLFLVFSAMVLSSAFPVDRSLETVKVQGTRRLPLKVKLGYTADKRDDMGGLWFSGPFISIKDEHWLFVYLLREGRDSKKNLYTYELKLYHKLISSLYIGVMYKGLKVEKGASETRYNGIAISLKDTIKITDSRSSITWVYYYYPSLHCENTRLTKRYGNKFVVFVNIPISETVTFSIGHKWLTFIKGDGERVHKNWNSFKFSFKLKF